MVKRIAAVLLAAGALISGVGCNAILGIEDHELAPSTLHDGGPPDAAGAGAGGAAGSTATGGVGGTSSTGSTGGATPAQWDSPNAKWDVATWN